MAKNKNIQKPKKCKNVAKITLFVGIDAKIEHTDEKMDKKSDKS